MKLFPFAAGVVCALLALSAGRPARAGDPMAPLVSAENWPEVRREAQRRLAADPRDPVALHALTRLAIDGNAGSERMRSELLPEVESCAGARPAAPLCQLAYGELLGTLLNDQGMLAALGSVDKVQAAFEAAVAADPASFEARESLVTYYLRAPGFLGGSLEKARRNADEYARTEPGRGRLLYALIDLENDDAAKAERDMDGLPEESGDADLDRLAARRWLSIGQAYLDHGKTGAARAAFGHCLAHGAPSVVAQARKGLDRLASDAGAPAPGG